MKKNSVGAALGKIVRETSYLLTLIFCVLKACDVIEWNWFWVMSPIFFTVGVIMVLWIITGLITCAEFAMDDEKGKNNSK